MGLAVLGDVSTYTARSSSFESLVQETNKGRQAWFVADVAALSGRLEQLRS